MTDEKAGKPVTKFERGGLPTAVLDVHEAAAYLGVAELTVRRMVRRGELPVTRIGRLLRFRVVDLDRYLEERTVRPPTTPVALNPRARARREDRQEVGAGGRGKTG